MTPDEIVRALRNCGGGPEGIKIVCSAADLIESMQAELADARNELCQKCGTYKYAHKGACDGCRWKEMPQ